MLSKERINDVFETAIKWCVYAIVFAAPFSKSISEIAITIAIVLWIAGKVMTRDYKFMRSPLTIPLIIFVAATLPSFFNSAYPLVSLKALFTKVIKFALVCVIIADVMRTKFRLKDLFAIALLSMTIIMVDGFFQYYSATPDFLHNYPAFKVRPVLDPEGFFRGFPTACFPFPNDLAAWILLALVPLACVTIFGLRNNRVRYVTAAVACGLFYLFFLAKARGAWVGLGLSALYISLSRKLIWLIVVIVLVLAILFFVNAETMRLTFSTGSLGDRFNMLGTSWQIFKNHPIIGNGINTFFKNFMALRTDQWQGLKGSYAHNCYLQMASDVGIVGLAGFLWLVFSYFRSVVISLKTIKDPFFNSILWGISIGVFAFLVHSFFDTNLYSLNLATLFWAAIGISQGIIRYCDESARAA